MAHSNGLPNVVVFGDFTYGETLKLFGPRPKGLDFPWCSVGQTTSLEEATQLSDNERQEPQSPCEKRSDLPSTISSGRVTSPEKSTSPSDSAEELPVKDTSTPAMAVPESKAATPWGKGSFASLFNKENSGRVVHVPSPSGVVTEKANGSTATPAMPPASSEPAGEKKQPVPRAPAKDDTLAGKISDFLRDHRLRGPGKVLELRGLNNRGHMCYIHSTLQSLLACAPLERLFRDLAPLVKDSKRSNSSTPVLDALVAFVIQFKNVSSPSDAKENGSSQTNGRQGDKNKAKEQPAPSVPVGASFEPLGVYRVVPNIHSGLSVSGKQEDAEEFLSALLNSLHEEILEIMEAQSSAAGSAAEDEKKKPATTAEANGDTEEWEEVSAGKKNKSAVTRVTSVSGQSPISLLFGGQIRSSVSAQGSKDSATLQPFMCLPLDIQAENIRSVQDALAAMCSKEVIDGFTCSQTGKEVAAARRITLSRLPPVLVLHIKRFVFDKTGGSQKLHKPVKFGFNLTVSKDLLAPSIRSCTVANACYRLFAVIFHHGKTAHGGHYTCDVKYEEANTWARCDDSRIHAIPDGHVMQATTNKSPYILFYRRVEPSASK